MALLSMMAGRRPHYHLQADQPDAAYAQLLDALCARARPRSPRPRSKCQGGRARVPMQGVPEPRRERDMDLVGCVDCPRVPEHW